MKTVFSRWSQRTFVIWFTRVIRYKVPPRKHFIKKLFLLNHILLCAEGLVVLSMCYFCAFHISLKSSAVRLFWCQEALVLPSRVNLIEEIFIKWKAHQEKCWAIASDKNKHSEGYKWFRVTGIPQLFALFGCVLSKLWWHRTAARDHQWGGLPSFLSIQGQTTWHRRDCGTALSRDFTKCTNKLK